MNIGQLTSMTNCEKCRMPMYILPCESEKICEYCGTNNNLVDNGFGIFFEANPKKLKLNIDKIKTIDDVKRILEFLNIKISWEEGSTDKRFEKVKDLFEESV